MAGLARVDAEEADREVPGIDTTVRFDMAEEVRRRWISIAAHYVAQRRSFEQCADLDEGADAEHGFNPAANI